MGNTVVAKPSEITPYTAFKLAEICKRINLPPGVLNIINGSGDKVGKRITNHPDIKAISFTGGTETGGKIFSKASRTFKKLALEMGGKNPAIIFEDCNYDQMLETVIKSSFTNQGQICLCSSRLLIEESIYEKFKIDFCERVSKIRIGDPNDTETQFGAITSKPHFDKINHYINLIDKENGSILVGGNIKKMDNRCEKGWFIEPTVVEGLGIDSQLNKDEIFGPIVTLQTFSSEEGVIKLANKTKYGLSATIWSEDISKANRVAEKIDSGVIWINCWMVRDLRTPFGGLKQSGYGKEGGEDALRFFTEQKNICIQS
jgi:aminomuconate-semialdehyde/2-hydroxymuconate-6-semialdehyde dehydrogenase